MMDICVIIRRGDIEMFSILMKIKYFKKQSAVVVYMLGALLLGKTRSLLVSLFNKQNAKISLL